MNFEQWSALPPDEQQRRCESLDPYESWPLLKAVEAAFMQQFGADRAVLGVFCGYANQTGPGLAVNVYLAPDASETSFPSTYLGFPIWCARKAPPDAALEPPWARGPSIRELLDQDEAQPLAPGELDDALWGLLSQKITSLEDAARVPREAVLYFASRILQWDVGNGGFAQAAYNIPEWFALAAEGYEALGKTTSARLIRDALGLLPEERAELASKRLLSAPLGRLFAHFRQSRMAKLDSRIVEADWYIDEERVAYVRRHRNIFRNVA